MCKFEMVCFTLFVCLFLIVLIFLLCACVHVCIFAVDSCVCKVEKADNVLMEMVFYFCFFIVFDFV